MKKGDYVLTHQKNLMRVTTQISVGVVGGEDIYGNHHVSIDPITIEDPAGFLINEGYAYEVNELRGYGRWTEILDEIERRSNARKERDQELLRSLRDDRQRRSRHVKGG